jgi:hypothetical protein
LHERKREGKIERMREREREGEREERGGERIGGKEGEDGEGSMLLFVLLQLDVLGHAFEGVFQLLFVAFSRCIFLLPR